MSSDADQEALAAAWAAELGAEDGENADAASVPQDAASSEEELAAKWAEALAGDEKAQMQVSEEKARHLRAQASEAVFKDMTDVARQPRPDQPKRELDFILDIPLDVSAELGRTRLLINELLQLGQGSVVELNKLAGEPLEVYVNGKLVARGEAVVINEKFGVRLTDIISPMERIKQLG
ncbi:MAG: flagellar motor switch protein FliN [Deltaproteobacteria bacterium]|jgi:flagellar motor switch protein FliN/FliY|nr:flagellar motor switch protein FliN [Deltaproteobacteria bacterium]